MWLSIGVLVVSAVVWWFLLRWVCNQFYVRPGRAGYNKNVRKENLQTSSLSPGVVIKELREKLIADVVVGMFLLIIAAAQVLDLCMHCPGH